MKKVKQVKCFFCGSVRVKVIEKSRVERFLNWIGISWEFIE